MTTSLLVITASGSREVFDNLVEAEFMKPVRVYRLKLADGTGVLVHLGASDTAILRETVQ